MLLSLAHTLKFILGHPLNRSRKTAALIRFFKWQIGSRVVPGQVLFNWINDTKMVSRPGDTGFTQNIYCGLHEFAEMAYLLHVLTTDDLFVDVGANVGAYTILACSKGASVYCFEPVPCTFERLKLNIRVNDFDARVAAFNLGVSDREGDVFFTAGENCTNHVVRNGEEFQSDTVIGAHVVPLDLILKDVAPVFLKIDVEGYETLVLAGAARTLKKESLHSVILELNNSGLRYGFDEEHILMTMQESGFYPYAYNPFSRKLEHLSGKNTSSGNTLFIRNVEAISEKVKAAPKVFINGIYL